MESQPSNDRRDERLLDGSLLHLQMCQLYLYLRSSTRVIMYHVCISRTKFLILNQITARPLLSKIGSVIGALCKNKIRIQSVEKLTMKILGQHIIFVLFVPSLLESRLSCSFVAELKTTLTSAGLFRDSNTSVISRSSALANLVSAARPAQASLVRPNPATAPASPSVRSCYNCC